MKFTILVYIPIYSIGKAVNEAQNFDLNDEKVLLDLVQDTFAFILLPTLLFYIMQTHEISWFYQY